MGGSGALTVCLREYTASAAVHTGHANAVGTGQKFHTDKEDEIGNNFRFICYSKETRGRRKREKEKKLADVVSDKTAVVTPIKGSSAPNADA